MPATTVTTTDLRSGLEGRYARARRNGLPVSPFAVEASDGSTFRVGEGEPRFVLCVREPAGAAALARGDRLLVALAYLDGALDLSGDMVAALTARAMFDERHYLTAAGKLVWPLLRGQATADEALIPRHYDIDPDFFRTCLDRRHRCYSHGLFGGPGDSLEDAMTAKLDAALAALGVRPGDHVLDVGAGWGAFAEHAALRGIRVTCLTLAEQQERYIRDLAGERSLPIRVHRRHLFHYRAAERFDAIVNMGATEHLPNYRRTLRAYAGLVKPGGTVYLDAAAMRRKYRMSAFMTRYVYPGNSSPAVLHRYLAAVAGSPFSVLSVVDDTPNYQLTCAHWARRLDEAHDEVAKRWGEHLYRRFRLFLWGAAASFRTGDVQAYRWVLRLDDR